MVQIFKILNEDECSAKKIQHDKGVIEDEVKLEFDFGILCQVWCLIVSIPDLGPLSYFPCLIRNQNEIFIIIIFSFENFVDLFHNTNLTKEILSHSATKTIGVIIVIIIIIPSI